VIGVFLLIFNGKNEFFMYRNVLLTDKEISLLKSIIGQTLHEKMVPEAKNLTIIFNRLREIKPLVTNNQFFNYGK
jgi:hypothetical protein